MGHLVHRVLHIPNAWRAILLLILTILMYSREMSKSVINLQLKCRGEKRNVKANHIVAGVGGSGKD